MKALLKKLKKALGIKQTLSRQEQAEDDRLADQRAAAAEEERKTEAKLEDSITLLERSPRIVDINKMVAIAHHEKLFGNDRVVAGDVGGDFVNLDFLAPSKEPS